MRRQSLGTLDFMGRKRYRGAQLAPWRKRVAAAVIDVQTELAIVVGVGLIVLAVTVVIVLTSPVPAAGGEYTQLTRLLDAIPPLSVPALFVAGVGAVAWNRHILRGTTGRSWGSRVVYLRLVDEDDGRPIGLLRMLGRTVCHLLDVLPFGVGFLLPLVTAKRQTIADMLMKTVVVIDERRLPDEASSFRRAPASTPAPNPGFVNDGFADAAAGAEAVDDDWYSDVEAFARYDDGRRYGWSA